MNPKLFHVVATANQNVIGLKNQLPWHFPADLKHFKELTTGATIIMGRKTYESIGRPLPNRVNMVLSRSAGRIGEGILFFCYFEDAFKSVKTDKAFIIGGSEIYRQTLDQIDGIYLTRIHADYEGDAFYPGIPKGFEERSRSVLQEDPLIEVLFYENTSKRNVQVSGE